MSERAHALSSFYMKWEGNFINNFHTVQQSWNLSKCNNPFNTKPNFEDVMYACLTLFIVCIPLQTVLVHIARKLFSLFNEKSHCHR